jgi:hypothetical protein
MNLRTRILKLEAIAGPANRRPTDILFIDLNGKILWDGTTEMVEWAGRSRSEWPSEWLREPWALKTIIGVDPLLVLHKDGLKQPFDANLPEDDAHRPNVPHLYNSTNLE